MTKSITKIAKHGRPGPQLGLIEVMAEIDLRYLTIVPEAPDHLAKDEADLWRQTAEIMIARGTLTEADLPTLELYCRSVVQVREMRTELREQGYHYVNSNGNLMAHPLSLVLRGEEQAARSAATALGLTPKSRGPARKTKDVTSKVSANQLGDEF